MVYNLATEVAKDDVPSGRRPSGSPSLVGPSSTWISPMASAPPLSPLQPLIPVPALLPSQMDVLMPTPTPMSLMFSLDTSSCLGRTLLTSSLSTSYMLQSSLSLYSICIQSLERRNNGQKMARGSRSYLK